MKKSIGIVTSLICCAVFLWAPVSTAKSGGHCTALDRKSRHREGQDVRERGSAGAAEDRMSVSGLGNIVVPGGSSGNITVGGASSSGVTKQTGDDAVSTNALVGYWNHRGITWVFGKDGRFAGLVVAGTSSWNSDSYGNNQYRSSAAYKHLMQGEYKVSGGIIKLFNCKLSTAMTFDGNYWNNPRNDDAAQKLLLAPLSNPGNIGGFSMEFEFIDEMRLRIRLDKDNVSGPYDLDFKRDGKAPGVPIPIHQIPPADWPAGFLSPEMPDYGARGRTREVNHSSNEEKGGLEYQYFWIKIDKTSFVEVLDYAAALRKAGWAGDDDEYIKKRKAETDHNSILYNSFNFKFQKGCYWLSI